MIRIFNDSEQVSVAAADLFVQAAKESIDQKGRFTVALTGGDIPDSDAQIADLAGVCRESRLE